MSSNVLIRDVELTSTNIIVYIRFYIRDGHMPLLVKTL